LSCSFISAFFCSILLDSSRKAWAKR
jgi:hypothetical protein